MERLDAGIFLAPDGIAAAISASIRCASSWNTVDVVRPQPGHAATTGVNVRNPITCNSSWATLTSRVRSPPGSGVSEMRIVSPIPCCRRMPSAAVEATTPFVPIPASVRPRCSAWSERRAVGIDGDEILHLG